MSNTQPEPLPRTCGSGEPAPGDGDRLARSRRWVVVVAGAVAATVLVAASTRAATPAGSPPASTPSAQVATSARVTNQSAGPRAGPSATAESPPFSGEAPADADFPPPDPDPAAPGQVVATGLDQSDPFLLTDGNRYYLYTSGEHGPPVVNVPVTSSSDFATWAPVTDALPVLPAWVASGFTWAPDVHRFGSHYVLYFTALVRGSHPAMECIGDALGTSPIGPFVPLPTPFICQPTLGGDIDPRVFTAPGGGLSMLWKSDQNIGGAATPTQMWSQPLRADGLALTGTPDLLLSPDQPWEGTIVEAPDMVDIHGVFWMTFSGNWFNQPAYAIGAARCTGPHGPCVDLPQNPLLASNTQGQGPGEASLFDDPSGVWLLYSPWRSLAPHPDPPRPVEITRLGFGPGGPYLAAGGTPPPLDPLGLSPWPGGGSGSAP